MDLPPVTELAEVEARRLLEQLPLAGSDGERRVRARLARSLSRPERVGFGTLLAAATSGAALVAAAAALFLGGPGEPEVTEVGRPLLAESEWVSEALVPEVRVSFQGAGDVSGTTVRPTIRWDRGEINVEVTPDRGIGLSVETREAVVRVVGTGFSVERDALGTTVRVQHGRVEVLCAGGAAAFVDAGGERTCLPTSAGGMLGRARALDDAGAQAELVLSAVDAGLALGGPAAVREELEVLGLKGLLRAGRRGEVVAGGARYLETPGRVRELEVSRMVAVASLESGGCAVATPWLERAANASGADEQDLAALAACAGR